MTMKKTTGERSSSRSPLGTTVCVVRGNMANDNDAADSAFGTLWEKAKQDLKHRMVPANEIIQMVVEFYGRPPPCLTLCSLVPTRCPSKTT